MSKTITVPAAKFAAEAAWIAKATPRSTTQPVFAAVYIGVSDGELTLRRTNYDAFAQTGVSGSGGEPASLLVDAAQLASTLKGNDGEVKIDVAQDRLRLAIDGRILSLAAIAVTDEYPEWPNFTAAGSTILRAPQLVRALTSVSGDETVPQLGAVKFENGKMVSTDRFRLTSITYDDDGFSALVPAGVLRPFASGDGLVRVEHGNLTEDGRVCMVRLSDWGYGRTITAPVMDAEFPKWRQLIPEADDMPISILLRRRNLLEALSGDHVDLTITKGSDRLLVRCGSLRDGGVEVEQDIEIIKAIRLDVDTLPFTVRINAKNLAGCLKSISAGAVQLMATKPDKPVLLQFSEDLHLVMPIRIPA